MSFNQVLAILRARWVILAAIVGLAVVVSAGVSLLLPKQYTSTSTVVVDVKSPDPVVGMVLPGMMTPGYMATQIDLIQSERVARRVIDTLRLSEAPVLREQWQQATKGRGDFKVWIAETLGKSLKIEPSRDGHGQRLRGCLHRRDG
jgi:polysaccharide biosynthesis transport protein